MERVTGRGLLPVADPSIRGLALATVDSRSSEFYHFLKFDPLYQRNLPYFIAHEAGHLLRLYSAPEHLRMLPGVTSEHRRKVGYELRPYLLALAKEGIPEQAVSSLLKMWHEGLIRQVFNLPVDMRIERWIFESYPGLKVFQKDAKVQEVQECHKVLNPKVREMAPPKVYRASVTTNASFAHYLARLFGEINLAEPYKATPYDRLGRELAEAQWLTEDQGHVGDMATVNLWADQFGIKGWFQWEPVTRADGPEVVQ